MTPNDPMQRNGLQLKVLDGVVDAVRHQPQAGTVAIRTRATREVLDRIGELTARTSAVFNSVAHPVPMELSVRRI